MNKNKLNTNEDLMKNITMAKQKYPYMIEIMDFGNNFQFIHSIDVPLEIPLILYWLLCAAWGKIEIGFKIKNLIDSLIISLFLLKLK